jgi:hypothetical protein
MTSVGHLVWAALTGNCRLYFFGDVNIFLPPPPPNGSTAPSGPGPPHRDITITHRHTTLGMTPLDG